MGGCFSDVRGGKQAIGGVTQERAINNNDNYNKGGQNDAVDFFYKSRGLLPLYTTLEVSH